MRLSGLFQNEQYLGMALLRLSLFLFLIAPLQAAETTMRFFAHPGGQVTIQGGHKPYDWDVRGRVIEGFLECGKDFPIKTGQALKAGKVQARLEGSIPVRSLRSSLGSLMDEFMYAEMNETNAPRILFRFSNWLLTTLPESKNAPYKFESRAELVLAGITNRLSIPLSVTPLPGNRLKVNGETFIKLADLGLEAAKPVSFFLKNGDEIKLTFEWFVGRKPPSFSGSQTNQ